MGPSDFRRDGDRYFECAVEFGDVYICHPLMLHSAFTNFLRLPRLIINGNSALREPLKFDRDNMEDYSLVELETPKCLGKNRLDYWMIYGNRKKFDKEESDRIEASWEENMKQLGDERDMNESEREHEVN